jgi:enamine deaminase RidA (YjgF/YER057c/UK114 family)
MSDVENRLAELGISLPTAPQPMANYVPGVRTGNLLYLSGVGPAPDSELTVEEGYQAARLVGINLIARIKGEVGDLGKVKRIVKLLAMVNSSPSFTRQPAVANGCSDLLVEVFGDKGRHARSAVGMAALPNDIPVEIEMIVELDD